MNLAPYIRDIADFPKPGIGFKDLTPLLGDARAFADSIEQLIAPFRESKVDCICGIEARGFIFGAAAATGLGCGFRAHAQTRQASSGNDQRGLRARVRQ
jgi:adenine phosphoribosyltransferase